MCAYLELRCFWLRCHLHEVGLLLCLHGLRADLLDALGQHLVLVMQVSVGLLQVVRAQRLALTRLARCLPVLGPPAQVAATGVVARDLSLHTVALLEQHERYERQRRGSILETISLADIRRL